MFPEPHRPLEEERCPVSDQFLAQLHRSSPCQVDLMIATVDPYVRTMLALYCYRRAHLFGVGLTVASACEEDDLAQYGGRPGMALFAAAREPRQQRETKSSGRPKITLSTGRLRTMGSLEDDELTAADK
jgi:hypothetical protein